MEENNCNHERIHIDELGKDMIGTCDHCNELFKIKNIKEGLYVIAYENKVYLLNTEKDMDLYNEPYFINLNNNEVCLYNNLNTMNDFARVKQIKKISE